MLSYQISDSCLSKMYGLQKFRSKYHSSPKYNHFIITRNSVNVIIFVTIDQLYSCEKGVLLSHLYHNGPVHPNYIKKNNNTQQHWFQKQCLHYSGKPPEHTIKKFHWNYFFSKKQFQWKLSTVRMFSFLFSALGQLCLNVMSYKNTEQNTSSVMSLWVLIILV